MYSFTTFRFVQSSDALSTAMMTRTALVSNLAVRQHLESPFVTLSCRSNGPLNKLFGATHYSVGIAWPPASIVTNYVFQLTIFFKIGWFSSNYSVLLIWGINHRFPFNWTYLRYTGMHDLFAYIGTVFKLAKKPVTASRHVGKPMTQHSFLQMGKQSCAVVTPVIPGKRLYVWPNPGVRIYIYA